MLFNAVSAGLFDKKAVTALDKQLVSVYIFFAYS